MQRAHLRRHVQQEGQRVVARAVDVGGAQQHELVLGLDDVVQGRVELAGVCALRGQHAQHYSVLKPGEHGQMVAEPSLQQLSFVNIHY